MIKINAQSLAIVKQKPKPGKVRNARACPYKEKQSDCQRDTQSRVGSHTGTGTLDNEPSEGLTLISAVRKDRTDRTACNFFHRNVHC